MYALTVTFRHDVGRKHIRYGQTLDRGGMSMEDIDRILEFRLREYLTDDEIEAVRHTLLNMQIGRVSTEQFEDIELELLEAEPAKKKRKVA